MSQITDEEVVFSSQYLATLEHNSNCHTMANINQEINDTDLVEEIQLSQDSEDSEGEKSITNYERVYEEM
ncbi:6798_t:CDS:1, partial [Paraglomus occultum]